MISSARTLAAAVVTLAAVPIWLAPLAPAAAAGTSDRVTEAVREVTYEDCTFRLINRYDADEQTQSALTRQVRTEECHFGDRNGTILVRACYENAEGKPMECSAWLRPTSDVPYAESAVARPVPRDSIHYVEIRGEVRRFDLAAPGVAPAPAPAAPEPPPPPPPPPDPPPAAVRTPTIPATDDPRPAATSPPAEDGSELVDAEGPEQQEAAPSADGHRGLAAALATGGMALLGLGGTGIWLLRRGGPGLR